MPGFAHVRALSILLSAALPFAACAPDQESGGGSVGGKTDGWGDTEAALAREQATAAHMEGLRDRSGELAEFLVQLPKGADLHSHLVGAVSTESLIRWGADDGLCVDTRDFTAGRSPCAEEAVPIADAEESGDLYQSLLQAWSMVGHADDPMADRHQHFFDSFLKFGMVTWRRNADMLAEARSKAAAHNVLALELMMTLGSSAGGRIAEAHMSPDDPWDQDTLESAREAIQADPDFEDSLAYNLRKLDGYEEAARELLDCDGEAPEPGCDVEVGYIVQAYRSASREYVFGQFVYAFALARADERVVGVNLVQAEEDASSLAFYADDMTSLDVLYWIDRAEESGEPVHIALHAGELVPELLPATAEGQQHLGAHIRSAVVDGHAERIGHGVDLAYDEQADETLAEMRDLGVMVELCLTSNERLLGVGGTEHPLSTYLRAGVATAVATDDEGILRTSMSNEFLWAAQVHGLGYATLKSMARNSLERSFLPGAGLRSDDTCTESLRTEELESACAELLESSPRASAQWRLEVALDEFERWVLGE